MEHLQRQMGFDWQRCSTPRVFHPGATVCALIFRGVNCKDSAPQAAICVTLSISREPGSTDSLLAYREKVERDRRVLFAPAVVCVG